MVLPTFISQLRGAPSRKEASSWELLLQVAKYRTLSRLFRTSILWRKCDASPWREKTRRAEREEKEILSADLSGEKKWENRREIQNKRP